MYLNFTGYFVKILFTISNRDLHQAFTNIFTLRTLKNYSLPICRVRFQMMWLLLDKVPVIACRLHSSGYKTHRVSRGRSDRQLKCYVHRRVYLFRLMQDNIENPPLKL